MGPDEIPEVGRGGGGGGGGGRTIGLPNTTLSPPKKMGVL